jgi:hypothetical protein
MILTTIDGIPLFSTVAEAQSWASSYGISGYHTHSYQGQTGYMGGQNHTQIVRAIISISTNNNTTPTSTTTSTTNSSGGGGGY